MRTIYLMIFCCCLAFSDTSKEVAIGDSLANIKENLIKENIQKEPKATTKTIKSSLDFKEIISASPVIYSLLFTMSITSVVILLYTLFTFRSKDLISKTTIEELKDFFLKSNYEEAYSYCESNKTLISKMMASGILARHNGAQFMVDAIKTEGKRLTSDFWHRISLLNDIVIIAPMLGLLGTVIGMFYAFYDMNRSIDSLSALFDGLGIAVGTTVAGLIVAIISMAFYAILKFKMIKSLNKVETCAISLATLIKTKE